MIRAHLDAASLARIRLSASPASEAVSWLRLTANGQKHAVFGDPGPAARFALRDPDVALLAKTLPPGARYVPDLLTPKPLAGSAEQTWTGQVDAIRETPRETVLDQLDECAAVGQTVDRAVRDAAERGTFARRAASGLATFWRYAVADAWPVLHGRMQADLVNRTATMAAHGVGALLGSLHPTVSWTGQAIEVDKPFEEELHYAGTELVLAPSVLGWPKVLVQLCDPAEAVLAYPALGVGAEPGATVADGLSRLLGATRASLLRDLDVPRSTGDLSTRHQLAPATVSYHLKVLHGSGLVTRTRDRRTVLYRRTEQGDALHG
ncbi:MAG: DUF5937 family protein [Labedaea sp.]